jgi:hypothetical protein
MKPGMDGQIQMLLAQGLLITAPAALPETQTLAANR